jgi:DNA-binding GntR family transcriptional regulator
MTAAAMAEALSIDRHKVRRAAQRLRAEGLLTAAPGVGFSLINGRNPADAAEAA